MKAYESVLKHMKANKGVKKVFKNIKQHSKASCQNLTNKCAGLSVSNESTTEVLIVQSPLNGDDIFHCKQISKKSFKTKNNKKIKKLRSKRAKNVRHKGSRFIGKRFFLVIHFVCCTIPINLQIYVLAGRDLATIQSNAFLHLIPFNRSFSLTVNVIQDYPEIFRLLS